MRIAILLVTVQTTLLMGGLPAWGNDGGRVNCTGPTTPVGGLINTNTTWTAAGNSYVVTCSILVSCEASRLVEH